MHFATSGRFWLRLELSQPSTSGRLPESNTRCFSGVWRLCSWYTFALLDFVLLPHTFSRTRDSWGKTCLCTRSTEKTARSISRGGLISATKNRLGEKPVFRNNPPNPPFNSSLFLHSYPCSTSKLEATDNRSAAWSNQSGNFREENSSTGTGRKFFGAKPLH